MKTSPSENPPNKERKKYENALYVLVNMLYKLFIYNIWLILSSHIINKFQNQNDQYTIFLP